MPTAQELKDAMKGHDEGGGGGGDHGGGGGHQEGGGKQEGQQELEAWAEQHGATLQHQEDPGLPPEVVKKAMERDGLRCVVCHTNENLTVHHVRHTDEEGEAANEPEDLNTVCATDHDALHNLQREALKREGNDGSKDENRLVGPDSGGGEGEGGGGEHKDGQDHGDGGEGGGE